MPDDPNRARPPHPELTVGGAAADIRQKLVEDAWFGRALSGQGQPTYYEMVRALYGAPNDPASPARDRPRGPDLDR